MPDAPAATVQADSSEPLPVRSTAGAGMQDRAARLLVLVRVLIDYGKQLAQTVQQRSGASHLTDVVLHFGTIDIPLILSRITRGLHLAAALEARLLKRLAHPVAAPAAVGLASRRRQHAAAPRAPDASGPDASEPDAKIANLPTPAHIAAQLRRRPIGAVLADICRDLGIIPNDPIWRELSRAIIDNNGNLATLIADTWKRLRGGRDDFFAIQGQAAPAHYKPAALAVVTGPH